MTATEEAQLFCASIVLQLAGSFFSILLHVFFQQSRITKILLQYGLQPFNTSPLTETLQITPKRTMLPMLRSSSTEVCDTFHLLSRSAHESSALQAWRLGVGMPTLLLSSAALAQYLSSLSSRAAVLLGWENCIGRLVGGFQVQQWRDPEVDGERGWDMSRPWWKSLK